MKNFRLPRKTKKSLKGNIWLYPADEKGNSLMAFPTRSQKDYDALKKGIVRNILDNARSRARKKDLSEKIDKETVVSNEELKRYVDETFREDLRMSAYKTLLAAKDNPSAIIAYYNFVNAFQLDESGEKSYGNICCMALDLAEVLLKK